MTTIVELERRILALETEVFCKNNKDVVEVKIGFTTGHNKKAKGASNCLGESEFDWANRIFSRLPILSMTAKALDKGIKLSIVHLIRPSGVGYTAQCRSIVSDAIKANIDIGVEQHFNACEDENVRGCEILTLHGRNDGSLVAKFADKLTDRISSRFVMKERRDDGVFQINAHHNGYGACKRMEDAKIEYCILEPAFAADMSFFKDDVKYIEELADCLLELAENIAKIKRLNRIK